MLFRKSAALIALLLWLASSALAGPAQPRFGFKFERPVYSAADDSLLVPIEDGTGVAILALKLPDFTPTVRPPPCAMFVERLAVLDGGRVLAAQGSSFAALNFADHDARELARKGLGAAPTHDLAIISLPDWRLIKLVRTAPQGVEGTAQDISSPEQDRFLYFVRPGPRVLSQALWRLELDTWRMSEVWPQASRDDFWALSAPLWLENGKLVVIGNPATTNRTFTLAEDERHYRNAWVIDPITMSVVAHPQNGLLRRGWNVQRRADVTYSVGAVGMHGPSRTFEYALFEVTPSGERQLGSLGTAGLRTFVFQRSNGERYVAQQKSDGALVIQSLPDFKIVATLTRDRIPRQRVSCIS